MKLKKFLSGLLSVALLTSVISVSAASFFDVDNDPTVGWAKPYITEMSERGYIKGYEDGTFKPNKTISKTEVLILLARMIGVNEKEFSTSVENAVSEFSPVLSKYSTNYEKEVAFLLYMGVLKESELDNYISSKNKNLPLKRYEAAVLLTKLLGAEDEVMENVFVSSSYADTIDIPEAARPHVEFVKEAGIMQGMGDDLSGMPLFSPNTDVTRSQMAKMLCCLIDVIDLSSVSGTILSIDNFNETITLTTEDEDIEENVSGSTQFKINGKKAALSDMEKGMFVKVTYINDNVTLVENFTLLEDSVIYGLISKTRDSNGTKTITLVDANDTEKKTTYTLSDDVKIKISGAIDSFTKLKANQYVALTIEDELVTLVETVDKNSSVGGTLLSVDGTGIYTILTVKLKDGSVANYEVSSDGVQVSRNSIEGNLSHLMEGDSVNLKLVYGKVIKIVAESTNKALSGTISHITYSTKGTSVGIDQNGNVVEYKVNKSANVIIDSADGSVYDLRPGTDVEIKLQSSEIVKIEAAGTVSKSQLTGIVKSTNSTYGLLVVTEGGVDYNVFVTTNTKIIDSTTGASMNLKSVQKGRSASITGSNSSGVLEATVIVLQ